MGIILERLFGSVDGGRDGADGGHGGLQCFLVSFGKNNNDDIEGVSVVAVHLLEANLWLIIYMPVSGFKPMTSCSVQRGGEGK